MHPMLRIRFERDAPISAPAAQDGIGAKRTEAGIGAGAWRSWELWIQKKPGVQRRQASRFLALCFTWRQEAANHHDIDCVRSLEGASGGVKARTPDCPFGRQSRHHVWVSASVTLRTFAKVVSRVPGPISALRGPAVASHVERYPRPRGRPRHRIHSVHRRRLFHPFRRPVSQRSYTVT